MSFAGRRFIFVMGTTASGKSDWALKLAHKYQGSIVNCDSVQTYQKLDIGAAKPAAAERQLVPHFLLDYVAPPNEITAGQYARDFQECVRGLPPAQPIFVVGGTGFYFMAIEKGMYPVLAVSDEIKKQVEREALTEAGAEALWKELHQADPDYAAKLHRADLYRIGRAIELIRSQGRSVTEVQKDFARSQKKFSDPLLKIAPAWDREVLKERIQKRTVGMIKRGLVDEVRALLDEGLEGWSPLASVGYRETVQALKTGNIQGKNLDDLIENISQSTRQLAKRQRTWFQRDQELHWIAGEGGFEKADQLVEKFLNP